MSRAYQAIVCLQTLTLSALSGAAVINVPTDQPTIQSAIDVAANGDLVLVSPGTYSERINFSGKAITVQSTGGQEVTTINATGLNDCVVRFNTGEGSDSVLEGFTLTGGTGFKIGTEQIRGGGVYSEGTSPTLRRCTITGNTANAFLMQFGSGGGVYHANGSIRMFDCVIRNNQSSTLPFGGGGGVVLNGSQALLVNCQILNNLGAGQGFAGTSSGVGGGMSIGGGQPTLINCTIAGNQVTGGSAYGGAMACSGTTLNVINCEIARNSRFSSSSAGAGGAAGLYITSNSTVQITNCTIANNKNSNFAPGAISGVESLSGSATTLRNCIVYNNNASSQLSLGLNVEYSCVVGGYPGLGNIDTDPDFIDPDGPDNIPGTVDDILRPYYGSPCNDAGNNAVLPADAGDLDNDGDMLEPVPFDLLGASRFFDDPSAVDVGVGTPPMVDMGAYESTIADSDKIWINVKGGVFDADTNWLSGSPMKHDRAVFVMDDNYGVTFDRSATVNGLDVGRGDVTLDLNGHVLSSAENAIVAAVMGPRPIVTLTDGALVMPNFVVGPFGTIGGDAAVNGNIANAGTLKPGYLDSGGDEEFTLNGDYSQLSSGVIETQFNSTANGRVTISGNATLAGTLRMTLLPSADPQSNQFYPVISTAGTLSGTFGAAILPFLGDDQVVSLHYLPTSSEITTGGAGGVSISITSPNGSPDPDDAQNFGLTGEPTGITGAFVQPAATESDLALSIADLDPQNNGNVLVLLNNGGGASFTPVIIEVGTQPSGIASAALADGAAVDDLAVPNLGDNTICVLFHEVSPPGNYTVVTISVGIGNAPSAITAVDLNGDALADLAVTNQSDNTVSILINNGNRTFTAQTPIPVGGDPVSIASGDFAGSPLNDLIIANSTSNTITILENLSGGATYAPSTIPVGPKPIIVTPTDVDNDRDLDALVSLETCGSVALLKNLGGGVMSSPITLPMDGAPGSMDAWDMDKDGDNDVVVVVFDDQLQDTVIRLLRNDSTTGPGGQVAYTVFDPIGQGENPQLVNGSDVSGDTVDDLVSVNVTPLPMAMNGGGGRNDGPRDPSMSIRRMLLDAEPLCRADVAPPGSLDGVVSVPDLLLIINAWGPCLNPNNCPADIAPPGPPIGDDTVGVLDLLFIINNWGPCW